MCSDVLVLTTVSVCSFAGTPKTTIQQPEGVLAVDFSPDARLLATVSKDFPQKFSLWDWQNDEQMVSTACHHPAHLAVL